METITEQNLGRLETRDARLVLSVDAPKEEWLAHRRNGITATDLPAILGLNRFKTAIDVWTDKTMPATDDPDWNEAAFWGTRLEEPVAQAWAELHNVKIRRVGLVANTEEPWQLASLDRLVYGCPDGRCALEVKTRSLFVSDEWEKQVPKDVVAQVMWQLLVTGLDHIHVAALIGGQRLVSHKIEPDTDEFDKLYKAALIVWQAAEQNTMPDLPAEYWSTDYLDKRHTSREGLTEISQDAAADFAEYQLVSIREKELEERKASLRTRLIGALGDAEIATIDGRPAYMYKASSRTTLDRKSLESLYPDVAGDSRIYSVSNTRSLRVSTTKEKAES